MIRGIFIVIFLAGIFGTAFSQNQVKLDSLQLELKNAGTDTLRMHVMLDLYRYYYSHDYIMAARYAQQVKDLAISKGNKEYEIKAERALAGIFFNMTDYKSASVHFFNAMRYYEKVGDSVSVTVMIINLGAVHDRLLEYDKSLEYYLRAQSLLNTITISNQEKVRYLTTLYNNIANIYQTKGDYQSARQYYEKTLQLAKETNNKTLEGIALNNLGKLFMVDLNQPDKAFEYLVEGLRVRKEVGEKNQISKSYVQLSNYYLRQKNFTEAKRAAQEAVKLAKEVGSLETQMDAYQSLSSTEEALGNFNDALSNFKQFKRISDSIQSKLASSELTKLQLQYDFEKAEQDRVQEREQIRTRYTIAIIILAAGLSIAVLLVIVIRSRARQTELKQKNLAQDVEIKNKELTTNVMYLIRKNELINDVAERLLHIKGSILPENQKAVHDIILDLQREADNDSWKEFEMRFNQVHSDFYDKLRKMYPGLSPADEKLCAFLRLNMSSKEIAAITKQSVKSVEVARARLRKKLNLTNTTSNLVTHLTNL